MLRFIMIKRNIINTYKIRQMTYSNSINHHIKKKITVLVINKRKLHSLSKIQYI